MAQRRAELERTPPGTSCPARRVSVTRQELSPRKDACCLTR
jgi:hypothetical protein